MTTPPLTDVPIRSADELTERWETVLQPLVFSARTLWMTWIGHDDLMLPTLVPVEDFPDLPGAGLREGLRRVHVGVAQSLRVAFDGVPVAPWPTLHLAAGGSVPPIDLLA